MYYVKCWLDARRGILAYVGAVVFCIIVWVMPYPGRAAVARTNVEAELVVSWSFVAAWVLAIAFGASGPGADIGEGFGSFLLTRPRSRAYFTWVAWVAGLSEVAVLLVLTVGLMTIATVIRSGVAWYHAPWHFHSSVTVMIGAIVIIALVTYSITYLLTTVLRSGKRAIVGTIVIMTVYTMAGQWLNAWSGLNLPSPTLQGGNSTVLAIGWLLFALACPLVAQMVLARAEV